MRNIKSIHLPLIVVCQCWLWITVAHGQGIKISGGAALHTSGAVYLKVTGNAGNLEVDDLSQLGLAAQSTLSLSGDVALNSASTALDGSLFISGSQSQTLTAGGQIAIANFNMNNSAGLNLQAPVLITGTLTLAQGNITTTDQYVITLSARNSFVGGSSSSYIDGNFAITTLSVAGGAYNFTFPVGNGSTYTPVVLTFTQNDASVTTYQVRMDANDIPQHTLPADLAGVSPTRYWRVTNGGMSNFQDMEITLPIAADDGVSEAGDAKIARSNGDTWQNLGGTSNAIPGTITSTEAFNALGDFIIASVQTINPPPAIVTNTGISVSRGSSVTITQTVLEATDAESTAETVTFTLTSIPANGILQKEGESLANNETFTQADINNERIAYVHDGGAGTDDSFSFTAADEAGATSEETQVAITILPLGTPTANAGADQEITDEDNDGTEEVELNGSASSDSGGTIESYVWKENESEIASGVTPTVSLTVGTHIITLVVTDNDELTASDTVVVTVNPAPTVNTPPTIENNAGLNLASGATAVIADDRLKVTDAESSAEAITYTLTQIPANGTLQRDEEALAVDDTFTQKDIDDGLIRYVHQNTSATQDSFSFTVEDEDGGTLAETLFTISITEDQTPPVITEINFLSAFLRGGQDNFTLSLKAADQESGISSGRFGYVGLSNEEEIVLEEITESGDSYSILLSHEALNAINDPLGIRYRFEFTNGAGLPSVTTGAAYWRYEEGTFNGTASPAGPWREIGQRKTEELTLSDYNIIAFPFEPQNINEVLGLGNPDNTQWRLFRHTAGTENFTEYGSGNFSQFEHGQGYFLIMRDRNGIDFGGQIAEMKRRDEEDLYPVAHEITLRNGWNLIGNPFPFAIDWKIVRAHPLNNQISNDLDSLLERLVGAQSDYQRLNTLKAFEGAFLNYRGNSPQTLYIAPSSRLTGNERQAHTKLTTGWELPITLEQAHFRSSRAGIGMQPGAREDIDWHDALQVPKLQGQAELLIPHPEYKMNRSVVPEQEMYLWRAEIAGGKAGEEVRLIWDNQLVRSLRQGLYLWDEIHSRLIDMREQVRYTFITPKANSLPLQIYYGPKEKLFETLDIRQLHAGLPYPNPADRQVILPLSIPQGLQSEHNVRLTLYNSQGQQISSYRFGQLSTGYHELEIYLPEHSRSGLYHYQVQVEGAESKAFSGRIVKQ